MKRGLMVIIAATGLAARSWAADLEGSWNVGGAEVSWPGSTCVVTYGPGDALQMLNQGPQNGKPGDPLLRVEAVGTFVLAGHDLKHTYSHVEVSMPHADEQTNRTLKEVSNNKQADLIKQIGSTRYQIKWLDDNSFEARADGLVARFTRVGSNSTAVSETEPFLPFSERPGFKESTFFWTIALGVGAALVIIWAITKVAKPKPKPPPRL